MKKFKNWIVASLALASVTGAVCAADADLVGLTPPDVAVLDQDNVLRRLSDYHGKVVVMHVCTAWCAPCQQVAKEHAGMVAELNNLIGDDKFIFVDLLSEDPSGRPSTQLVAQSWINAFGTPADVWQMGGDFSAAGMDIVNFVFNATGSPVVPTNMVIGPDGVITYGATGWNPRVDPGPLSVSATRIVEEVVKAAAGVVKTVRIDIKPGGDENVINLYSAGVIPAAILSDADFDAMTEVDPASIRLAGAGINMIGKSDKYGCSGEDVNSDGYIDLNCRIYTAEFMIEEGQSVAVLEAETYGGERLRGEDSVRISP